MRGINYLFNLIGNEAENFKDIIPVISSSPFADSSFIDFRSLLEALLHSLKES